MGFGLDVGESLAAGLAGVSTSSDQTAAAGACGRHVRKAYLLLIFLPVTISFSVLLNARRTQLLSMTGLACLAFVLSSLLNLSQRLSPLSPFIAALAVGVVGNMLSNATGRPAIAATSSGVFILVPGCAALRSATHALSSAESTSTGLALTGKVLTVAVSIGAGLFVASLCVPHREVLLLKRQKGKGGYYRTRLAPVGL